MILQIRRKTFEKTNATLDYGLGSFIRNNVSVSVFCFVLIKDRIGKEYNWIQLAMKS